MSTRPQSSTQRWILCALIALCAAYSALHAIAAVRGEPVAEGSEVLWTLVFSIFVMLWSRNDTQSGVKPQRDYTYILMFILWPVVLAHHLIRSRGAKGLMLYFGFLGAFLAPYFVQMATWACCGHSG